MSLFKLPDFKSNTVNSNYVHDPLFILINDIQYHYSRNKAKALKGSEADNFNKAVILFFSNITISDANHLNYVAQKLRLTKLSSKDEYIAEMVALFNDEDKISQSAVDFKLRAILYIYRYYHNSITEEVKYSIKEGIMPLLKYL